MRTNPIAGNSSRYQLREATRQVEAQFLHQLLRALRRTVPTHSSSYANRVYTDMLDEVIARQLAQSDQFGLGKMLYEKLNPLLKQEETGGNPHDQS